MMPIGELLGRQLLREARISTTGVNWLSVHRLLSHVPFLGELSLLLGNRSTHGSSGLEGALVKSRDGRASIRLQPALTEITTSS